MDVNTFGVNKFSYLFNDSNLSDISESEGIHTRFIDKNKSQQNLQRFNAILMVLMKLS